MFYPAVLSYKELSFYVCSVWRQERLTVGYSTLKLTLVTGSNCLCVCLSVSICSSVVRHAEDVPAGGMWWRPRHTQVPAWYQHLCPGGTVRQVCPLQGSVPPARTARTAAQCYLSLAQRSAGQYNHILTLVQTFVDRCQGFQVSSSTHWSVYNIVRI
jgi:hypothetical protein